MWGLRLDDEIPLSGVGFGNGEDDDGVIGDEREHYDRGEDQQRNQTHRNTVCQSDRVRPNGRGLSHQLFLCIIEL